MNYYIFDSIQQAPTGQYFGYKGNDFCEVYPWDSLFDAGDDEETIELELLFEGLAKCDAPDWSETMLVEEADWDSLNS